MQSGIDLYSRQQLHTGLQRSPSDFQQYLPAVQNNSVLLCSSVYKRSALNSTSLSRMPSSDMRLASKSRVSALALPTIKSHPANNDVCEETAIMGNSAKFRRASRCASLDGARHFFVVFVCSSGQRDGGPWCRVANLSGVSNIHSRETKCTKC